MSYARKKWRRHPDSDRRIGDLQSPALPLGYGAVKDGALGRNRTNDTRIFSPLLYQLSYQGTLGKMERATRFELATSTLARWRSAK